MNTKSTIYLAGGCFWGTERFFQHLMGVVDTEVGYANGNTENPSYEDVCDNDTGYAETVRVCYDPTQISLRYLLELFFETIDPTQNNTDNRQISGFQYRTGIYYSDPAVLSEIQIAIETLQQKLQSPTTIEIKPLKSFYLAEDYHQNYLIKNPNGYCHVSPEMFLKAKSVDHDPYLN